MFLLTNQVKWSNQLIIIFQQEHHLKIMNLIILQIYWSIRIHY